MAGEVEMSVRGPEAYGTARRAIEEMERHQIWPTPLNYELWIHCVAEPEGELAQEIERLIAEGSIITEAMSESLAVHFLPKNRLTEEIRDTGDQLNRQLEEVSKAIDAAQRSSIAYSKTLAGASRVVFSFCTRRVAAARPSTMRFSAGASCSSFRSLEAPARVLL